MTDKRQIMRNSDAARCIERRWEFANKAGSFRAEYLVNAPEDTGLLATRNVVALRSAFADADGTAVYVVWSYGTPIAWDHAGALIVPYTNYSPTTAKHQAVVNRAAPFTDH